MYIVKSMPRRDTKQSISMPITGRTVSRLVITVRAQNDMRPQGSTYPRKAVPIIISHINTLGPWVLLIAARGVGMINRASWASRYMPLGRRSSR